LFDLLIDFFFFGRGGAFAVFLFASCNIFESHLSDLKIRHIKQGKGFVVKMEQIISKKPSNEET